MNSNESWIVQVDLAVYKFLKKIPRKDSERILFAIDGLSANPFSGDIQKMKGEEDVWRKRVGAYRIFYEVLGHERAVHVFHAERRTSNTY